MVTSDMFISLTTRFITSVGQGAPAMMPVRRWEKSKLAKSGWPRAATNIVGTPYRVVHFSAETAASVVPGSNASAGKTMVAPVATQPSVPMTMPK